jgi:hypothetical protein
MITDARIIIPDDVDKPEELRKQLRAMIKDPRVRHFEELRAAGFDSETSMELSDLTSMDSAAQAEAVLGSSGYPSPSPVYEAVRVGTYEMPAAMRNVGAAAGSAMGAAVGMSTLRLAAKHSQALGIGVGVVAVVGGCVAASRVVAAALGPTWAAVAVANIVSAASIVGFAFWRTRR